MSALFADVPIPPTSVLAMPTSKKTRETMQDRHQRELLRLRDEVTAAEARAEELQERLDRADHHINRLVDALTASLTRGSRGE